MSEFDPATGRYDCPACDARFDSVGEKKRRIRETHPKENRR